MVVRDLGSPRGTYLGRNRLEPNRGAVWEPTRMVRAADAVFSLEVATEAGTERLLEPLAGIPDGVQVASQVGESPDAAGAELIVPLAQPAEAMEANVPASSPVVDAARADARAAGTSSRDPRFVIALLAIVLGVVGAAALIALLLS